MGLNILNTKKGSFICLFFVLFFYGCSPTSTDQSLEHKLAGNALGTKYHITYLGSEISNLEQSIDSILKEFNYGVSTYDSTSLISHYNANKPISAKDLKPGYKYLNTMISISQPIVVATNGAFDPSAAMLFRVYDQAKRVGRYLDSNAVNKALTSKGMIDCINYGEFSGYEVTNTQMNFNAIAKGYFVDLLAAFIDSRGSDNYMVEVGGEVRCLGNNAKGAAWSIGINRPVVGAAASDYFEVISLSNMSMATSGNYKNFYTVDDKIIGHTFDPRTGQPVISDLKSATIMHKECAIADAYATACMVLGLDASKSLIEKDSSLSAYFIYEVDSTLVGVHVK
jgi:thiamine biosynthesis lipoprotein